MNQRHLQAFHDELSALVKAGVPLDRMLGLAGQDVGRRAGHLMQEVGTRIEQGQTLEQALAAPDLGFPPAYQALVRTGLRTGRLPAALESLADQMRTRADTRRLAFAAMIYPTMVLIISYSVFIGLLFILPDRLRDAYQELEFAYGPLAPLLWLRKTLAFWAVPVPLAMAFGGWYVWRRIWRNAFDPKARGSTSNALTRALQLDHAVGFCRSTAALLRHDVPLPEALRLAGDTTGSVAVGEQVAGYADRIEQGRPLAANETLNERELRASILPPMVVWILGSNSASEQRIEALEHLADRYEMESERLMRRCSTGIPIFVGAVLGGAFALVCCLLLFAPVVYLYTQLGGPQ